MATRIEFRFRGGKSLNAKIKRIDNVMRGKYAVETAYHGLDYARVIMPVDTGALFRALQVVEYNPQSAKLRLNQPNHPKSGTSRPYHMWMHGIKAPVKGGDDKSRGYDTSMGKYRPTSGEPKFMEKSYIEMKKHIQKRIKNDLNKI